ncbi:hypothetical protein C2E20_6157 [Micractinium conductrix]|uniref:Uncharacterized protein n=1 Tax=Micractinium conductrix TaxID=554055 RepID=A0A2P6V8Q6_9CHLO|nr:hypothetical protein C2E20_6157 [Micractinium conductrix]|eukprot:PSC70467.1 hypothetical protein C2E20_6157 [Micractinium conductrix]
MLSLAATRPACAQAPPVSKRRLVVHASRQEGSPNNGRSGIHDPPGWGQRGNAPKSMEAGLEQQRQLQAQHLGSAQKRSSQAAHPGGVGIDRFGAANKEILEVEKEKAGMREESASDDEWAHMSKPLKWWMEAKAVLYSWLRTGVEPL